MPITSGSRGHDLDNGDIRLHPFGPANRGPFWRDDIVGRMDLARMPPPDTAQLSRAQATVLNHLLDGMDAPTLARKLARGNRAKAKQYRQRFRRWMAEDTVFAAALASGTRAELQLASPSMAQALIKRGQRGRVDAIKLVWEAGTFHNPRVDHSHEHSGEVTIKLESVGRPAPVLDEAIVDADVVE